MAPTNESTPLIDGLLAKVTDNDPQETAEWKQSLDALIAEKGQARARYILLSMLSEARLKNVNVPGQLTTPYVNTIDVDEEPYFPGDEAAERQYRRWIRWNAAVMVTRAQRPGVGVGGHISSYASVATLYEVGLNHFFRGKDHPGGGDHIFFQGHASPGPYARAFIEGRLTEADLDGFRQEYSHPENGRGLPSYPHPRRMEDFWEFPTVSMGLGPAQAIYQAWFDKYLHMRGIKDTSQQRTWAFLGDGEMDEPESRGMLQLAAQQQLDNLTFVINCNLQRLDGPVRGNGKIIQELEAFFRGAGWNVIKVIWGRGWDRLLAADKDHALVHLMNETLDGDYQTFKANDGAYVREHFFGRDPRTAALVKDWTDEEIWALQRGGNDYRKMYAAYKAATEHTGAPTVILAHTVKGYALGSHFAARNSTHQMKKLKLDDLKALRDTLHIPISDAELEADPTRPPYYKPAADDPALLYMLDRRRRLGGFIPERRPGNKEIELPDPKIYNILKGGSGKQEVASTMAFVRLLKELIKDKRIGKRIVPIIPDEARTFGLDSIFPSAKIFNTLGQNYLPVDANMMLSYREAQAGQIMHTGINEAGSASAFQVAGTSFAVNNEPMIPVYIFYSMFGFQRTGDSVWAAADQMARGFLLGATAGRTTLTGEGLQHMDGHSPILAGTNPAVISYDPAFAYEVAHIIREGIDRMYGEGRGEDVIYYLTVYNEPTHQPAEPENLDVEGLHKGIYLYSPASGDGHEVSLLASGIGMQAALQAKEILAEQFGVKANIFSVTSWNELAREGHELEREQLRHPDREVTEPFVAKQLSKASGPFVAVSDFATALPEQIRKWVPGDYTTLGADGFGFSDTRPAARRFFNIDAESVVVAALSGLAREGKIDKSVAAQAAKDFNLSDPTAV